MDTPYDRWIASQGIDIVRGFFVEDLYTTPLKWWDRIGGNGVCIMLDGAGYMDDAYVIGIPPGKSLNPQRHIYEALVYVLAGRGATTVWQNNGAKQSFRVARPAVLFALPLNAWYQHFNGQGDQEARLLSVTTAPLIFNLFHCADFVINNPYSFTERFKGEEGYFAGSGKLYSDRVVETNFVADAINIEPVEWSERGKGNATIFFEMSESMMGSHVSRFPVGHLQKGPSSRSGRACVHSHRQRLFAALARGQRDDPGGLEAGIDRRAAGGLVSSAFQFRRRAVAISGAEDSQPQVQVAARQDSVRRASGVWRLADRVRGRGPDYSQDLRSGMRQVGRRSADAGLVRPRPIDKR